MNGTEYNALAKLETLLDILTEESASIVLPLQCWRAMNDAQDAVLEMVAAERNERETWVFYSASGELLDMPVTGD